MPQGKQGLSKGHKTKARFQPAVQAEKHHKLIRELPERAEQRVSNIRARNEMLRAADAQNLSIERQRTLAHLHGMPPSLQRQAAQEHVGDLTRRIHKLAQTGLPK